MRFFALLGRARRFLAAIPFGVWLLLAGVAGGVLGLGAYTFSYAQGLSYLSDDPRACANCHVMQEVYDAWNHGSHKSVAVCNDCHIPHALVPHYALKMFDGWNHSVAFTSGNIPEPIRIMELDRAVALQNCLECHADLVTPISHVDDPQPTDCLRCHSGVGHWLAK
jgi:cytochrome c nitrite reductase small subunit